MAKELNVDYYEPINIFLIGIKLFLCLWDKENY